jgi:hypothetical protein
MITASQIQKKIYELKDTSVKSEVLVINISDQNFEMVCFTKEPYSITRLGEISFNDAFKNEDELNQYFLQFVNDLDLSKGRFNRILINWLNKHFTLVPDSFYSADKAKELLNFNVGDIKDETVLTNEVLGDVKFVYSIPTSFKTTLDRTFPKHNIKHFGYSTIQLFFSHFQLKGADVFLNIHDQGIELCIKKDKQLLLYNMFSTKSDEDILYYLMFSIEQFKFEPGSVKLCVAANRETNDELFKTLKKYIKNVNFAISDKIIERKETFESIPHHYYFTLLNRLLCE